MLRLCPARRGTKTEWFTGSTCWANQTGRTIRSRRARHPHGATSQQRCSEIKNMFHFLSETQEARQRMCKLKTKKNNPLLFRAVATGTRLFSHSRVCFVGRDAGSEPLSTQLFYITERPVTGGTCPCSLTDLSLLGPLSFTLPLLPSWLLNFLLLRAALWWPLTHCTYLRGVIKSAAGWNVRRCKAWEQDGLYFT